MPKYTVLYRIDDELKWRTWSHCRDMHTAICHQDNLRTSKWQSIIRPFSDGGAAALENMALDHDPR